MNVELQLLDRNLTSRFSAIEVSPKKPQHIMTGTRCQHIVCNEDGTVTRCANYPQRQKANGFLCWKHEQELFPSVPVKPEQIPYDDEVEQSIIENDTFLINMAALTHDPNQLRLSHFPSCRREWNQRARPAEARLVDFLIWQ